MKQYKARVGEDGRLTPEQVLGFIEKKRGENTTLEMYEKYAKGDNEAISKKDDGTQIPVPYGRTLVRITTGFMYKPGLITYSLGPDGEESLLEDLQAVFKANKEEKLNASIGRDQVIFGEGYELHYIDEEGQENFARVSPFELIPIYSYEIKPRMLAAIRFYDIVEEDETVTEVDIYYPDRIEKYVIEDGDLKEREAPQPHPYDSVPVAVFRNDDDSRGDIEPVKALIDAYDSLISAYSDDEHKFAEAVLLLFGRELDDESIDKLDRLRILDGLDKSDDDVRYLTKDETQSARQQLIELLRSEIYRQSFVPDLTNPAVLGQKSGEAFQYLFALFELMASVKESFFQEGIQDRIRLSIMGIYNPNGAGKDPDSINVEFSRNLPKDSVMWTDIVQKLWGMLPSEALIPHLPFIDDPEGVISEIEADPQTDLTAKDVISIYGKQNEAV